MTMTKTMFEEKWKVIRSQSTARWKLVAEYDLVKVDTADMSDAEKEVLIQGMVDTYFDKTAQGTLRPKLFVLDHIHQINLYQIQIEQLYHQLLNLMFLKNQ